MAAVDGTAVPRISGRVRIDRSELVLFIFVVGFLNGIAGYVHVAIRQFGFETAFAGTFGISVLVWVCAGLVVQTCLACAAEPDSADLPSVRDWAVAGLALAVILVPAPHASFVALTMVAGREIALASPGSLRRRAGILILAATVPTFWSRLLFQSFSGWILNADAVLVSRLTGTERLGNAVAMSDGSGYLWIASGCSSLANLSLAVLCWVMFTEYAGRPRRAADYATCGLACLCVLSINISRIAAIGLRPDLYELIHGPVGATAAGYLTALSTVLICAMGSQRDPASPPASRPRPGRGAALGRP